MTEQLPHAASTTNIHRPLKLACLEADDSEKWQGLTLVYFRDAFSLHPDDEVTLFDCAVKGEFPSVEDVENGRFDAIFIGGSRYSAYDDSPWIMRLRNELIPAYYASKKVKLIGICFGHQLLAQALGGRVGKNPSQRFVLKVEDVDFNSSAIKESCGLDLERIVNDLDKAPGRSLSSPIRLKVIESHGDQVLTLPPGGVALASSSTAQCEMFSIPGVVLACQSHPEFPGSEVVLEKIHSALSSNGTLSPEEATASKDSLEKSQLDSQPVRLLIRSFMEGP